MATERVSEPSTTSVWFARGVIARLAVWPALRIAVEQGWGGPETVAKRTWLASVLVDAFEEEDPRPDVSYVELTLLQVMEDEFDTVLEDGSAETVAKDIVALWEEVQAGGTTRLQQLEEQMDRLKGKKVRVEEAAGDCSDWEDESEGSEGSEGSESDEVPTLLETGTRPSNSSVEVDEDGFTLVKSKGKSHR